MIAADEFQEGQQAANGSANWGHVWNFRRSSLSYVAGGVILGDDFSLFW